MENTEAPKPYYARAWPPAFISGDFLLGEMRKQSNRFAEFSDRKALYVTYGFAMGGALANIISHFLAGFGAHVGMFWGIWIPFCCLLIPLVHYLSRQVVELRERLDALEARVESSDQN